ncbi:MAG: hypothetical protein Faunusvirus13_21 [Faunusvirus sp.]|uniref:Uncharacterized protein n=1 Tax=Faunusvirus sp. TaxID=2487766 RepID=A0A3G4ZWY8_9VIRU|nr:MAG: hypothetical protein Faunusvirus13_21 [Faunusvirus sp.]
MMLNCSTEESICYDTAIEIDMITATEMSTCCDTDFILLQL